MVRIAAGLAVLLGTLLWWAGPGAPSAAACSCAMSPDEEAFEGAHVVFTGRLAQEPDPVGPAAPDGLVPYQFDVELVHRGTARPGDAAEPPGDEEVASNAPAENNNGITGVLLPAAVGVVVVLSAAVGIAVVGRRRWTLEDQSSATGRGRRADP